MKMQKIVRCASGRFLVAAILALATAGSVRADYASTVLNDHPIAYYALDLTVDNGGTATDLSGNGNSSAYYNIIPSAGPSSYLPNAAYFTGASVESYVDLSTGGNPGILNFSGPITMEAWVQSTNATQGPADILAKGYDISQNYDELCLRANGGVNYYGGTYNNSNGGASASGGLQTTNWTYLVSTFDGTNWNLYVNGQTVGHGSDTVGAINFSDSWAIGTGSADGFRRFFAGNICQVALYTNSLTPAQVKTHYYAGLFGVTSINSSIPLIVTQPLSQAVYPGSSATFSVVAVSASAVTNQWLRNGVPLSGQTNSTLTIADVLAGQVGNYSVILGNANGITNSVAASLSLLSSGNSLEWTVNGNDGVWDTATTASWLNVTNNQTTVFNSGDKVLFDDTVGVPTAVTIDGTVSPSSFTVNASTNEFTFSGSGTISGSGSLLKAGASTLTIITPGNFTGPVMVNGGVVYAGNNCFKSAASITITNNSTVDFGGGNYNTGQPVIVSGTGVTNEGALYNSYNDYPNEAFAITLAGNTTFGGSARWDLNGGSLNGPHAVTINWVSGGYGEWNTVAIATNVGNIEVASGVLGIKSMGSTFGNPASTFTVDSGSSVDFWTGDAGYAKNFHILNGGNLQLLAGFTSFSGNLILENGATLTGVYGSGNQAMNGTVTLNGTAHFVLGDANFIFTNVFSGAGGFVWDAYNHELNLDASNTYSGVTVVGNGETLGLAGSGSISHSSLIFFGGSNPTNITVDASGRGDGTLTLAAGQTLGGIGEVNGALVESPGAAIAPAGTNITLGMTEGSSSTGTIGASGVVRLNGTTVIKLNGPGVNDLVQSGTSITYGGNLNLINISGAALAVGDSFQIFSAPSYSGSFASITPATPGPGLAWDTSQLSTSGFLNVVAGSGSNPVITSTTVAGGNLIFGGTGGSANTSYTVFTSTNLAAASWVPLVTNSYSATGTFSVTNAINKTTPALFYLLH